MVENHRQTNCLCNYLAQRQLPPTDVRGVDSDPLLSVYQPGNHEANRPHPRGLRYLCAQFDDGVNGCRDDGVRAEVSGRWPVAANVLKSVRIEDGGLDSGATDIHSYDKIALNGILVVPARLSDHLKKVGLTVPDAAARRD